MQAATNWSSHLKKQLTFGFFQTTEFLSNFQKSHFSAIFENHHCTRKRHCMRLILHVCEHGRRNPAKIVLSILQWLKLSDRFTLPVSMLKSNTQLNGIYQYLFYLF